MAAAKKAATTATANGTATKAKKTPSPKAHCVRLDDGSISGPFASAALALAEVSVSAEPTSIVTLYREVKKGKLITKVKLA